MAKLEQVTENMKQRLTTVNNSKRKTQYHRRNQTQTRQHTNTCAHGRVLGEKSILFLATLGLCNTLTLLCLEIK